MPRNALYRNIRRILAPPVSESTRNLRYWREVLLHYIHLSGVGAGIFVYLPSLFTAIDQKLWSIVIIDSVVFWWLVAATIVKQIPFAIRAGILCGLFYILGVMLLIQVGPISQIYLLAFSIFSGLMFGLGAAVFTIGLNAATLLILGYAGLTMLQSGFFTDGMDLSAWIVVTMNFVLVNAILSIALVLLLKGLESSYAKEHSALAELTQERIHLVSSNQKLHLEIEERRKIEAELTRLAAAIEQSNDAIVILNVDRTPCYANKAYEQLFGRMQDSTDAPVTSIFERFSPVGVSPFTWSTVEVSGFWRGRLHSTSGEGPAHTLDLAISAVRDNLARPVNYVAVVRDVSHEIALEERLRQAEKLEAIGTLAGGIAHDFNNILSSIIGNAELIELEASGKSSLMECTQEITRAGRRAKDLVNQILMFSRRIDAERKPVWLGPLIEEALKLLRPSIPSTVEINCEIAPGTHPVNADATQLHQVVVNLCTNAYQSMDQNGGTLTIQLREITADRQATHRNPQLIQDQCYVQLTVTDTGLGMDVRTLERAFDPFFTTKDKGKGTGLGLATVHGIVSALGGVIGAHSVIGKGTSMTVYLPAGETDEIVAASKPALPVPPGNQEHVLVVDDETALLSLSKRILERLGYSVTTFAAPMEALIFIRNDANTPDVVITDQTMPKMTGLQLAQEIERIKPGLPVILASGFSEDLTESTHACGAICSFLNKPYTGLELASALQSALEINRKGGA
ncbi:MAG: hypothetical protein AMXMBFR84_05350 [Candidatus Hydrogenedentota bacterium]